MNWPASGLSGAGARRLMAPQQRGDARHQLTHAERLGEVVVGAALEAEDLVGLGVARRQHQDRRAAVHGAGADRPADGDAVEIGQHQVEQNQIEALGVGARQGVPAVVDLLDRVAAERQVEPQQFADGRVVLDDQHATRRQGRHASIVVRRHTFFTAQLP